MTLLYCYDIEQGKAEKHFQKGFLRGTVSPVFLKTTFLRTVFAPDHT